MIHIDCFMARFVLYFQNAITEEAHKTALTYIRYRLRACWLLFQISSTTMITEKRNVAFPKFGDKMENCFYIHPLYLSYSYLKYTTTCRGVNPRLFANRSRSVLDGYLFSSNASERLRNCAALN